MKRLALMLLGLSLSWDIISQELITIDSNTLCRQIENSIVYLKKDKKLRNFRFISERETRYGGYEIAELDYIEEKLGFKRDSIYYLIKDEKNKESIEATLNFINNPLDTVTLNINCNELTFDQKTVNTVFSKIDNQTLLINLTTGIHKKSNTISGRIFLFFFEEDQSIKKVKEYKWKACG